MKTSRFASEANNRFSIYGTRSLPEKRAEKDAGNRPARGILKRVGAAVSRFERKVSSECRTANRKVVAPLVGRAKYAVNSKLSKLQAATARASSSKSQGPKGSGTAVQHAPACRPEPLSGAQLAALHCFAVSDIKKLIVEFSAVDSDVPTAVATINEFSKSLRASKIGLNDVTYDQITTFLEKAEACAMPALTPKARDFLLRAQSKAPERLETGTYVTDAPSRSARCGLLAASDQDRRQ